MTRELGILTWDEAFLSLRSILLPDALRAKYCELIIGQYSAAGPLNIWSISPLFRGTQKNQSDKSYTQNYYDFWYK